MKTVFKICSCCKREYVTKEQFIKETAYIGDMDNKRTKTVLKLYNCNCGSTLSVKEIYK